MEDQNWEVKDVTYHMENRGHSELTSATLEYDAADQDAIGSVTSLARSGEPLLVCDAEDDTPNSSPSAQHTDGDEEDGMDARNEGEHLGTQNAEPSRRHREDGELGSSQRAAAEEEEEEEEDEEGAGACRDCPRHSDDQDDLDDSDEAQGKGEGLDGGEDDDGLLPVPPLRRCYCRNCTAPLLYDDVCEDCLHNVQDDEALVQIPAATTSEPKGGSEPNVVMIWDERMEWHQEGKVPPHPERPDRVRAVRSRLLSSKLADQLSLRECREVTREELAEVHSDELIDSVYHASRIAADSGESGPSLGGTRYFTPDTFVNAHTNLCARLSAGACVDVATAVVRGEARGGVAVVRPPGHHAESNTAMGFCFFNNAAVAARAAQAQGAEKVLILDWDVHHGNGTQHIFESDGSVMYMSLHRYDGGDFYPGTGAAYEVGVGDGEGFQVNVPWDDAGRSNGDYMAAFQHLLLPIAYEFAPDLIIVSAGFDAADGDPIGGCLLTPGCFAHMTAMLRSVAPLALLLEGGYNLKATAASMEACIRVMLGEVPPPLKENPAPSMAAMQTIRMVQEIHSLYWRSLRIYAPSIAQRFFSGQQGERPGQLRGAAGLSPPWAGGAAELEGGDAGGVARQGIGPAGADAIADMALPAEDELMPGLAAAMRPAAMRRRLVSLPFLQPADSEPLSQPLPSPCGLQHGSLCTPALSDGILQEHLPDSDTDMGDDAETPTSRISSLPWGHASRPAATSAADGPCSPSDRAVPDRTQASDGGAAAGGWGTVAQHRAGAGPPVTSAAAAASSSRRQALRRILHLSRQQRQHRHSRLAARPRQLKPLSRRQQLVRSMHMHARRALASRNRAGLHALPGGSPAHLGLGPPHLGSPRAAPAAAAAPVLSPIVAQPWSPPVVAADAGHDTLRCGSPANLGLDRLPSPSPLHQPLYASLLPCSPGAWALYGNDPAANRFADPSAALAALGRDGELGLPMPLPGPAAEPPATRPGEAGGAEAGKAEPPAAWTTKPAHLPSEDAGSAVQRSRDLRPTGCPQGGADSS